MTPFDPEQLAFLRGLLTPYCCHITGMHDVTHFAKNPAKLCIYQKAEAYDRICQTFGWTLGAISKPGCYWCEYNKEHPLK